ncbi:hypothetical protein MAR_014618 [Mya arenaria]|uniref:Uncharacterized protein n=1 Tax=Mya arenaria TaxID=6604 RepID=A0ABY7G6C6_MYAAR|nr:hypothetical protein MAR_014618 [Mya arenaria]
MPYPGNLIVRNVMKTVQKVAFCFNYSAKRLLRYLNALENDAENREAMERRTKLQSLCETRWAARSNALHTFRCSVTTVVNTLEDISLKHGDTKAGPFKLAITQFGFIASLVCDEFILAQLVPLSQMIQNKKNVTWWRQQRKRKSKITRALQDGPEAPREGTDYCSSHLEAERCLMSRVIKLTLKAMEVYCERVEHYYAQLNQLWAEFQDSVNIDLIQLNYSDLCSHENKVKTVLIRSNTALSDFNTYLIRTCSEEKAAKAKAVFAHQEAALRKQRAQLDEQQLIAQAATARQKADVETELLLIHEQKEVAAAVAEANTFGMHSCSPTPSMTRHAPVAHPMDRVLDFVNQNTEVSPPSSLHEQQLNDQSSQPIQLSHHRSLDMNHSPALESRDSNRNEY